MLARARAAGISDIVVPAVDEASWSAVLALGEAEEIASEDSVRCHGALGLHPVSLPGASAALDAARLARLEGMLVAAPVVALGECGIDTAIDLSLAPLERQLDVLRVQLQLAHKLHLPVILHARGKGAYAHLLTLLKGEQLPAGGVIHSYGGGVGLLAGFAALGLHFGFAGPATYANARKVREAIAEVPEDRLLVETDAPDQTPAPHRQERNEPAYLVHIVDSIAEARGQSAHHIARVSTANACRLFRLGVRKA